jgi:hypothetical protein
LPKSSSAARNWKSCEAYTLVVPAPARVPAPVRHRPRRPAGHGVVARSRHAPKGVRRGRPEHARTSSRDQKAIRPNVAMGSSRCFCIVGNKFASIAPLAIVSRRAPIWTRNTTPRRLEIVPEGSWPVWRVFGRRVACDDGPPEADAALARGLPPRATRPPQEPSKSARSTNRIRRTTRPAPASSTLGSRYRCTSHCHPSRRSRWGRGPAGNDHHRSCGYRVHFRATAAQLTLGGPNRLSSRDSRVPRGCMSDCARLLRVPSFRRCMRLPATNPLFRSALRQPPSDRHRVGTEGTEGHGTGRDLWKMWTPACRMWEVWVS